MLCKVLVNTETAYKDGTPHALVTGIDICTQKYSNLIEFDYQKIFDREDKYADVIGFYHTSSSETNNLSFTDIETMSQWTRCLGKNLICVVKTKEKINGWAFVIENNFDVQHQQIQVFTKNDINYDIWFEPCGKFWNPIDFLLEGDYYDYNEDTEILNEVFGISQKLIENQVILLEGFNNLTKTLQTLIESIIKEDTDEQSK